MAAPGAARAVANASACLSPRHTAVASGPREVMPTGDRPSVMVWRVPCHPPDVVDGREMSSGGGRASVSSGFWDHEL